MRLLAVALISVPGFHCESAMCGQSALLPASVGARRPGGSSPLLVGASHQSTHTKQGRLPKSEPGNCVSLLDLFSLIFRRRVCRRGNG